MTVPEMEVEQDPDIIFLINGLREAEKSLQTVNGRINDEMIHCAIRERFGRRVEIRMASQFPEGKVQIQLYDRETNKEVKRDIFTSK